MKPASHIALLYALICAVSAAANLGSQALAVAVYGGVHAVKLSILVGTLVGLPIKYWLEKRHIFEFTTQNLTHDGKLFVIYAFMGVFTTLLFWGIEYGFHHAFDSTAMRYLGGALGLTLGSVIKYQLDKRYVFVRAPVAVPAA